MSERPAGASASDVRPGADRGADDGRRFADGFGGHAEACVRRRARRRGGVVAAWRCRRCTVDPAVVAVVRGLHEQTLGTGWPDVRRHVPNGDRSPDPPGDPIAPPPFETTAARTRAGTRASLHSRSASRRRLAAIGRDAVSEAAAALGPARGAPHRVRTVQWPLPGLARRLGWRA